MRPKAVSKGARVSLIAGGTVAALGGIALGLWFGWLPRYRPALAPAERYGIDVS